MRKLWNKYGQVIAYLFWGVVTTLVNIVSFQFLSSGSTGTTRWPM